MIVGEELLAECKAQLEEEAREGTITFNICSFEDAQDFANILIKNGYEVSLGPISLERTRLAITTAVTIFGTYRKGEGEAK